MKKVNWSKLAGRIVGHLVRIGLCCLIYNKIVAYNFNLPTFDYFQFYCIFYLFNSFFHHKPIEIPEDE